MLAVKHPALFIIKNSFLTGLTARDHRPAGFHLPGLPVKKPPVTVHPVLACFKDTRFLIKEIGLSLYRPQAGIFLPGIRSIIILTSLFFLPAGRLFFRSLRFHQRNIFRFRFTDLGSCFRLNGCFRFRLNGCFRFRLTEFNRCLRFNRCFCLSQGLRFDRCTIFCLQRC